MCNIAAYVGERRAAPILIEMMKREEGFEGGYSTGIATIHEGKIYYAKLVGDTARLEALTEAASLPGNIGFIHSRSGGREGVEWAHPFVSIRDGEVQSAYIANGGQGYFRQFRDKADRRAEELLDLGYGMRSRATLPDTRYPTMSDGTSVHMSDLMCQEIQHFMDAGNTPPAAMDKAFHSIPAEIVGLLLTLSEPNSIAWSRINMPMWIGFSSHGAYLGTTAVAFPEDAGVPTLLPGSASGRVYADRYEVIPYKSDPCKIARINPEIAHKAYEIIYKLLEEGDKTYPNCYAAIKDIFPAADCIDSEPLTYGIIQTLAREGRLEIKTEMRPGHAEGLFAPLFRMSLKK